MNINIPEFTKLQNLKFFDPLRFCISKFSSLRQKVFIFLELSGNFWILHQKSRVGQGSNPWFMWKQTFSATRLKSSVLPAAVIGLPSGPCHLGRIASSRTAAFLNMYLKRRM